MGISSKFVYVLKALYSDVQCIVWLNGNMTEQFNVNTGLKQGCVLSSFMLNIYLNSLIERLML